MAALEKLSIRGFKSIQKLEDFELKSLNVLIGSNGSGKSNFVEFFRLLQALVQGRFQLYVNKNGPADGFFFNGVSFTRQIEADLVFGLNRYKISLQPTAQGGIVIADEATQYTLGNLRSIGSGRLESALPERRTDEGLYTRKGQNSYVYDSVASWQVYHFHDTSMNAGMRREGGILQSEILSHDAANLPAFLLKLRHSNPEHYGLIRKTLQRIAPFFDDFQLHTVQRGAESMVSLTWKQIGSDYIFSPGHFSDGTIRFLCLVTALVQPKPPTTIVLDEPELGLHPEALMVLAGLVRAESKRMQIVMATQSPQLVSEFEPEQIITVDQVNGSSQFNRLHAEALADWLNEFTLGELWQKGTIRGGVNHA
jgi:predicted ATPase